MGTGIAHVCAVAGIEVTIQDLSLDQLGKSVESIDRMLERQVLARVPDARVIYVDARSVAGMKEAVVQAVGAAEHVIAAVYVVPTAGKAVRAAGGGLKNTVAMDDATGSLLAAVLDRAAERTVVLAMGNPYVIEDFPAIQNYVCAFSNVTVSETAAIKALFGEIPIGGHLPVTIPGVASRGDDIAILRD